MTANNFNLQSGSTFISANALELRSLQLIADFTDYNNQNIPPNIPFNFHLNYAETRPFMINNSTFNINSINGSSLLITSTNPQVIIVQNTFNVNNMDTSGLMVVGNYKFYNGPSTLYYVPGSTFIGSPSYPSYYMPFTEVEQTIFNNFQGLYEIFNNTRTVLNLYDPVNPCFFISVQQNTLNYFEGQNNKYIIQITHFEFQQSTVGILNNSFINVSSSGSSNIIGYDTINRGTFAYNSLSGGDFNGYFFLLSNDYFQNIVFFENTIDSANESGLYSIQAADCDNIAIRDGIATNIQSNLTFIEIDCSSLYTQVILMNHTFQNITRGPTSGLLEAVNFISIINEQFNSSSQPTIVFQDVVFQNISIYNTQFATQNMYVSSLISILSIQASSQFVGTAFDSILATPDAGIMTLSIPDFTLNNSAFSNLLFGNINGAINIVADSLLISGCTFQNNSGSPIDGAGLFKLGNRDLSNPGFYVTITDCTFSDNVAPYGTILYTTAALVNLSVNNVTMLNNQVTEKGGLIYFFGGSDSTASITNSNIIQNAGYDKSYPSLEAISFDSTGVNISAALENCNFTVSGNAIGAFVSISTLSPISLIMNNISYTSQDAIYSSNSPTNIRPEFGLFEGDNFAAQVNGLQATNVSLNQTSLFVIHCNTVGKTSYNWNLVISESIFANMNLSKALIEIDSDGDAQGALESLSLMIQNTQFSNISWLAATTTAGSSTNTSVLGGIINSLTSQIGRDSSSSAASAVSDYAVTLQNCNFTNLTGQGSLVFNTVESMYDGVLLVNVSNFSTLSSSGPGTVVNPSTVLLTSFNSNMPPLSSINSSRNNSLMISQSYFKNITAQEGCIVYWQSAYRGLAVSMRDNNFSSISCAQDGGILYANYYGSNSLNTLINNGQTTLEHSLIIISINNNITNINVGSGGFMFLSGESTLFQVDIENNAFNAMKVSQNGGAVCTSQSAPQENIGSSSSSAFNSRLLSSQVQTGNVTMTNNNFANISASNGGIIYDSTNNNTINFSIISNSINSVSASQRGGVLYVTNPGLNIISNTFTNIAATGAGNLVYSLYGEVNGSTLANSNIISNKSVSLVAFGPTNLYIGFISTLDGSILQLENDDTLQYNPTAPNLTSYSLSDYLISVTLMYLGDQGSQVVFDDSPTNQINLTMYFTSPSDSTPTKTLGEYNCFNSTCTIAPNDIVLKGLAGDRILVNSTYESASYTQSQLFYISLRACIPGEINQTESEECSYCKFGTYSLIPTDLQCNDCPNADATCYGGTNISINPGYYRSNSSSTTLLIFNCNDTSVPRCLGGPNNTCIEPFTGPGCLQCDGSTGYISSGKLAECDQCYNKETLFGYATILVIVTIGYQMLMVYVTYTENRTTHEQVNKAAEIAQKDANKAKNELKPGQFMVIFSTFNQISSTFANMDVGTVTSLLGITENVGNSNTKVIFSLRCLFRLAVPDDFSELRFQILVYVFSPLAKVLVALILELIRSLIWRDKQGFKVGIRKSLVKIGAVAVVITLLEQPAIIGILCAYLTCDQLDPYIDDTYIQGYSTIQCYTDRYSFFSHVLVIPALVFWAFVVPLIIFFALYKNREKLHTSLNCRLVLGNFYTSYKEEAYYWGLVIISLKITIFVLNAVLVGSQVVKGVVFIIIIHLYFILLRWRPPFRNHRLFIAEKLCCYAYMMMLTLVLFRISFDQDGLRNLCSVLILISIAFAGAYIVINLALLYLAQFKTVLSQRVQKKKDKKICIETLNELQVYHKSNDNHHDSHRRRKAITMDLPKRLRNTEEFEETLKKQVQESKPRTKRSWIYKSIFQAFSDQNASTDEKQPKGMDNPQKAPASVEIRFIDKEKVQSYVNKKKFINLETSYEQKHDQTAQKSGSPSLDNHERIVTVPIDIEISSGNVSKAQILQRAEPLSSFSSKRALKLPLEIEMGYNNVSKAYASQKLDSLSPDDGERILELPNDINVSHDVKINFDDETPSARLKLNISQGVQERSTKFNRSSTHSHNE